MVVTTTMKMVRRMAVVAVVLKWARTSPRRMLGAAAVVAVWLHNHRLERERAYYTSVFHMIQTVVFVVRKTLSVGFRRMVLGVSNHPYWTWYEEIVVRTINFSARTGDVTAPRAALDVFEGFQRVTATWIANASVRNVDMGLGHGKGDALWITLDKKTKLGSGPVILYYHGGGYCVGSAGMYINAHCEWLRRMRDEHGMEAGVLSIEYPLAPETKYPENLKFAYRAYDHLVDDLGVLPSSIVLGGDSAGGGIAFSVAKHAHEHRLHSRKTLPALAGIVLISPWVNHSCESDSHGEHVETDYIAGADLIGDYTMAYCGDKDKALIDPSISAIHSHVDFLPPIMLTLGTREVFGDDIRIFRDKLHQAGKPVTLHEGEECPHIHPLLWPLFDKHSTRALSQISHFCAQRIQFRENHNSISCAWQDRVFLSRVQCDSNRQLDLPESNPQQA
ncbi:Esterase [Durusdinium trenchii]|uniref:Esterase n=1 Tax=Durusdinium trenchii TaxID=1381693 RepID=A0ABP0MZ17_9DINO